MFQTHGPTLIVDKDLISQLTFIGTSEFFVNSALKCHMSPNTVGFCFKNTENVCKMFLCETILKQESCLR